MRINATKTRLTSLISLLTLVSALGAPVRGQNPSDSTQRVKPASAKQRVTIGEDMVRAYEAALVELDHLRRVEKLRGEELEAYKRQLAALEAYVATLETIVEKQRKVITEGETVAKVDERIFNEFKSTVSDLKIELERVRKSRDRYRGFLKAFTAVGFLLGAALGYVLGNK